MGNKVLSSIDFSAPVYTLSVGQLLELLNGVKATETATAEKEYLYGLKGICNQFGVCKATAVEWKKTWLAPACSQTGRKIIVDKTLAVELFNKNGRKFYEK